VSETMRAANFAGFSFHARRVCEGVPGYVGQMEQSRKPMQLADFYTNL